MGHRVGRGTVVTRLPPEKSAHNAEKKNWLRSESELPFLCFGV